MRLTDIRQKLLLQHDEMGLIKGCMFDKVHEMTKQQLQQELLRVNETFQPAATIDELRTQLTHIRSHRHLKVWHDHSTISSHGHLLVTVACIYDSAFYFTQEEMRKKGLDIDVQTVVEKPEVYILGRSNSSLADQARYNEVRRNDLCSLVTTLKTKEGMEVTDVMRFFHGDAPTRQYETGSKIGGDYPCNGCGAFCTRFNDLTYCFRSKKLSLAERQEFVTQGEAWKRGAVKPFDKLTKAQLQRELESHGVRTNGLKKGGTGNCFH